MIQFLPPPLRRTALLAAQDEQGPIFISGEPGTGKSQLARWIHRHSLRGAARMTRIPPGLSDEEFFGRVSQSDPQGSVLIDEIGGLSPYQTQLVGQLCSQRTLADSRGFVTLHRVRVILCSTQSHEHLEESEQTPECPWILEVPPLRERQREFEQITLQLLDDLTLQLQRPSIQRIQPDALQYLKSKPWHENLRELREALRKALAPLPQSRIEITLDDL